MRRRRRLLSHALPLAAVAIVAFLAGLRVATAPGRSERTVVGRYVNAWARRDYATMYSLLDPASRRRLTLGQFAAAYQAAARTATVIGLRPGRIGAKRRNEFPVAVRLTTSAFGALQRTLQIPLAGSGSAARVLFSQALVFPGLRRGEQLHRTIVMAPRAALLARDGTPLAEGPKRTSPIAEVAAGIAGRVGPIPSSERRRYEAAGYPPDAKVGLDGLERIFERRLAGVPGDTLLAGDRVIARRPPIPGGDVTTTIDPAIERAVIGAIAGRFAAVVALDPRSGGVLAAAGLGFSALQPPGSTMKIVTVTGALEAGIVSLTDTFPVATSATIDGYQLQNANGEACGGTLVNAFAVSCNSVFAPIGVKLGARRLVATAERFGFNQPSPIPGAAESTIPPPSEIGDAVAVGSSAIGQGRVEASALQMADVAATIAMGGRRPIPTLLAGRAARFVPVTSSPIAALVQRMMVAVVQFGTGTAAQIQGVQVAGKTGTAEIHTVIPPTGTTTTQTPPPQNNPQNTDAWFVGYAPVGAPRIVVAVLFPSAGAGGESAAPAAREILLAGLQSSH